MGNVWQDIALEMKNVLLNAPPVSAYTTNIQIGRRVRSIPKEDYPVIVIGTALLSAAEPISTNKADRTMSWDLPVFLGLSTTPDDIDDGSVYLVQGDIENETMKALLTAPVFQNEAPFLSIDITTNDIDEETKEPLIGSIYIYTVRKRHLFD